MRLLCYFALNLLIISVSAQVREVYDSLLGFTFRYYGDTAVWATVPSYYRQYRVSFSPAEPNDLLDLRNWKYEFPDSIVNKNWQIKPGRIKSYSENLKYYNFPYYPSVIIFDNLNNNIYEKIKVNIFYGAYRSSTSIGYYCGNQRLQFDSLRLQLGMNRIHLCNETQIDWQYFLDGVSPRNVCITMRPPLQNEKDSVTMLIVKDLANVPADIRLNFVREESSYSEVVKIKISETAKIKIKKNAGIKLTLSSIIKFINEFYTDDESNLYYREWLLVSKIKNIDILYKLDIIENPILSSIYLGERASESWDTVFQELSLLSRPLILTNDYTRKVGGDTLVVCVMALPPDLPASLHRLRNMVELDLSGFAFSHLPQEIGSFPNLKVLNLSRCSLKSVPGRIAQAPQLRVLDLSFNLLEELPLTLPSAHLKVLKLAGNSLTVLPALPYLDTLDLRYNNLDTSKLNNNIAKIISMKYQNIFISNRIKCTDCLPKKLSHVINFWDISQCQHFDWQPIVALLYAEKRKIIISTDYPPLTIHKDTLWVRISRHIENIPDTIYKLDNVIFINLLECDFISSQSILENLCALQRPIKLTYDSYAQCLQGALTVVLPFYMPFSAELGKIKNLVQLDIYNKPNIKDYTILKQIFPNEENMLVLSTEPPAFQPSLNKRWLQLRIEQAHYLALISHRNNIFFYKNKKVVDTFSYIKDSLCLYGLALDSIPNVIKNYPNIIYLDISNNPIKTIPAWVTIFENLSIIDIRDTQIEEFPEEFYTLSKMKEVFYSKLSTYSLSYSTQIKLHNWLYHK